MIKIENNNIKNLLRKIKFFLLKVITIFKKTWFFTIVFFTIVFCLSLWIWWSCIFRPSPSEQVISDIQKEQKDFEKKEERIELIIKNIQERSSRFQEASDHQINRKIFKSSEEIFQEMNPAIAPSSKTGILSTP